MRKHPQMLAGGLLAAVLLTACGAGGGVGGGPAEQSGPSGGKSSAGEMPPSGGTPSGGESPSGVDVQPTITPQPGDCVGVDGPGQGGEVWVVDCANPHAVARVTRQVTAGQSDLCTTDDYTGFDFSNDKPSLCLMLFGREGDCYSGWDVRMPVGPRVECTDPEAVLRLEQIITSADHTACDRFTRPGDPNAAALYYGGVPDFDATPEAVRDLTFCLGSPAA